ncbi:hypothetical protein SPBR_01286 [Sporothrix brasiliensis 5110]|uniref:ER membrane protein complex subunit 1 n=1 Tax=Sporothrix brasiliensis 5110 TaxID=1398154 RepID=A0A0C2IY03_9PEZI|nr:uncharacterized protein SPBR_01286 [Sporothrix brasiliensis 5110]KIH91615.1 hypothetical protein SPBR_01286 [Sporothrix brasiliensis 5110]
MRSFRALALLVLAASAPAAVDAIVYKDQVGDIDFHHQLVGLPQRDATFFHRPRRDDKASLLYTLSDVGVLGAVNPSSGALVWRQLLGENDDDAAKADASFGKGHVEAVEGEGWLAAGLGHSVHAWNAVSGRSVWWADFAGEVADVAVAGAADKVDTDTATLRRDVLALLLEDGHVVLRRLTGNDGHVVWEHRETHTGNPSLKIAASADRVYAVSIAPGATGLKVLAVDAKTGHRVEDHALASDIHAVSDVLFVGGGIVAWTDSGRTKIKVSVLGTKQKHEFALPERTESVIVHALRSQSSSPSFLVHTRTADAHRGQVYHVDLNKGSVQKAYDLPQQPGAGAFAVTASDADAVYFTRITDDEVVLFNSVSHGILGRWPVAQGAPLHASGAAAAEVAARPGAGIEISYAVRTAVLTADEDWVLIRNNGQRTWSRPEGLTGAVAAALADRPESEQLVRALEEEEAQSPLAAYVHRVRRHVEDLAHLPAFLQSLPGKLLRSILGGASSDDATPVADPFGFHKLAILATRRGRLYGLDAASPGSVLWTAKAVDTASGPWKVQKIYVDEANGVATVVGATAGESVAVKIQTGEIIVSTVNDNVNGAVASAVLVNSASGPYLLPVPEDGSVPAIPVDKCPTESIVIREHASAAGIRGVRFVASPDACAQETTWTFSVPPQFRIVDVATRPAHDPVASIGRVLGDRTVLYKYLNPNLAVVAAINDETGVLMTFLLDTVSGQLLSSATYDGVDGSKPVECLLFENTFLCTYFADYRVSIGGDAVQTIKGYHLAVSDMYESTEPNNRGVLGSAAQNTSAVEPLEVVSDTAAGQPLLLPAVTSATWVVGSRLTSLAVTQTRQGISVRHVLAYVPRLHGIVGLPRVGAVLDPRRPVGRAATPQEAEEGLVPYAPQLEIDPRLVVSHERDVLGIQQIVTAATHVESTSLVLAFGRVDVFGTRVAPSLAFDLLDKGFGKLSMLATVAALAVGVFVLRPIVTKKQINLRWKALL